MKEEKAIEFAGDLFQEVDEVSKIISDIDGIEQIFTNTVVCSNFLTIYCC